MKNIFKIVMLILLIFDISLRIKTLNIYNQKNITENNIINENIEENEDNIDLSNTQILPEKEENLEEQEVESETFELQGEIAYEGGKTKGWNLNINGIPKLTYISQVDEKWKNYPYTVLNNKNQTIGTSGCGVATAAMIVNSIVGNISVTDLADTFVKYGYRSPNNGTYWSANRAIADEFNIEYKETSNFSVMLEMLKNNNYIVASVGNGLFTTGGHYIMIYGLDNETLKIYDPFLYNEKFDTSTRRNKVYVEGNTVYCSINNFKNYANFKRFFCYKYNEKKLPENVDTNKSYIRYVRVSSRLNIRNGNGIGYKIIGKLKNGEKVTVYETKENWSRIGENMLFCSDYLNSNYISKNTVGNYKRIKVRTYLYSKSNLTGKKYTYLANTKVKIIKNITENIDYIYVVKTGRYAYINNKLYK